MSYVLTAWRQPEGVPLPVSLAEAGVQLDAVQAGLPGRRAPAFLAMARTLEARFPDNDDDAQTYDSGQALLEQASDSDDPYYNIGLSTGIDRWSAAYAHVVVQANDLGLHLFDMQEGSVYLANGDVFALGEPDVCVRAVDAWLRRDFAAAWAEYRRLRWSARPERPRRAQGTAGICWRCSSPRASVVRPTPWRRRRRSGFRSRCTVRCATRIEIRSPISHQRRRTLRPSMPCIARGRPTAGGFRHGSTAVLLPGGLRRRFGHTPGQAQPRATKKTSSTTTRRSPETCTSATRRSLQARSGPLCSWRWRRRSARTGYVRSSRWWV